MIYIEPFRLKISIIQGNKAGFILNASEAIKIMEKSKVLLGITPKKEGDDVKPIHDEPGGEKGEMSGSSEDSEDRMPKRIGVRSGPLSIMEIR